MDKEYAGIIGIPEFTKGAANLALGENNSYVANGLVSVIGYLIPWNDYVGTEKMLFRVERNCSRYKWNRLSAYRWSLPCPLVPWQQTNLSSCSHLGKPHPIV